MKFIRRGLFKSAYILLIICICILYLYKNGKFNNYNQNSDYVEETKISKKHVQDLHNEIKSDVEIFFPDSGIIEGQILQKKSYESPEQLVKDYARKGPGEQGAAASLPSGKEKERYDLWYTNGFNALLSDSIALDRALKDTRHRGCQNRLYPVTLPTVSVVIPFFEEHWTTLLRTVTSVLNRSPKDVLKEIILVDDGSSIKNFLKEPLDEWCKEHIPNGKWNIVRLPERRGLIEARQEGAKEATADVIIVLDSHCEVMMNWLPPLLEPIMKNHRTVVCPLIDVINKDDFAYYGQDDGGRGAFDWRFFYKRLPLRNDDIMKLPEPFENPVMNGGLFAISRKFFWELGGYDIGIRIWGGEQYDLSFKIWLCGGKMYDAPCSRVGHIFRDAPAGRPSVKGDFLSVNYKRVAEVWMGSYANALYQRNPHLKEVDGGDLTKEIEIRDKLQCKSFDWYLKNVAPDLVKHYPPYEPPDYANGTIKSDSSPTFCMDNGSKETGPIIIYGCHGGDSQYFSLNWRKTIKIRSEQFCWTSAKVGLPPFLSHCQNSHTPMTQIWHYDPDTKQIMDKAYKKCAEIDDEKRELKMAPCDELKAQQKWTFLFTNADLIRKQYPHL